MWSSLKPSAMATHRCVIEICCLNLLHISLCMSYKKFWSMCFGISSKSWRSNYCVLAIIIEPWEYIFWHSNYTSSNGSWCSWRFKAVTDITMHRNNPARFFIEIVEFVTEFLEWDNNKKWSGIFNIFSYLLVLCKNKYSIQTFSIRWK